MNSNHKFTFRTYYPFALFRLEERLIPSAHFRPSARTKFLLALIINASQISLTNSPHYCGIGAPSFVVEVNGARLGHHQVQEENCDEVLNFCD